MEEYSSLEWRHPSPAVTAVKIKTATNTSISQMLLFLSFFLYAQQA